MKVPARQACARAADGRRFTLRFTSAVIMSALAAALLAPLVAYLLAAAGIHMVFPRIFDRLVMVVAVTILVWQGRALGLPELLRDGFRDLSDGLPGVCAGLGAASAIIIVLFILAARITQQPPTVAAVAIRALRYFGLAMFIGVFEEGFFRAVLLAGLRRDFSTRIALNASSIIYALAHLVRAPQHHYVSGFQPAAGFTNLGASLARLVHPDGLLAMVFGLFLLGIVLGEAFILTGRVYLSISLHAGFILGAKCWPAVAGARVIPRWLAGPGPVPLIAAPAAWVAALLLLVAMWLWFAASRGGYCPSAGMKRRES